MYLKYTTLDWAIVVRIAEVMDSKHKKRLWKLFFFGGGGVKCPIAQFQPILEADKWSLTSFAFLYSRTHFPLDKQPTTPKHFSYQKSIDLRFMKCFAILLHCSYCFALLAFLSFQSKILKNKITVALEQGCPKLINHSVTICTQGLVKCKIWYQFNSP